MTGTVRFQMFLAYSGSAFNTPADSANYLPISDHMGDERFGLSRSLDMFLLSRRQLSGFRNRVKGSLHSASVVELELLIFGKFAT